MCDHARVMGKGSIDEAYIHKAFYLFYIFNRREWNDFPDGGLRHPSAGAE